MSATTVAPTVRPASVLVARRARGRLLVILAALVVLALVVLASLALGVRDIDVATVWQALTHPVAGNVDHDVVRDQRVPRTLIGLAAGAALGIAVYGSVLNSVYADGLPERITAQLPPAAREAAEDSLGGATGVAAQLPDAAAGPLVSAARSAFVDGYTTAAYGVLATAAFTAFLAVVLVPKRTEPAATAGHGRAVPEPAAGDPDRGVRTAKQGPSERS